MPKHNKRAEINNRLAKRANQIDPRRSDLLREILEESSSISLNDGANQPSARQALDSHSKLLNLIDELRKVESICNPKLPVRTEKSWSNFFSWIDSELGKELEFNLSDRVGVIEKKSSIGRKEECALISKINLNKSECIFDIHRKVMLSSETAINDSDLFEFIKTDSIASTMQNVVLVLHLLNEYSKGYRSYWSPYLAILPNNILPILTMDKDKLSYLMASSHIFEALKLIRAIARQYSYFFKRLQATDLPLTKDFTFQYYCWGVSIVCSRQNEIPPVDRKVSTLNVINGLIPILDMCNHDGNSNHATFENNRSKLIASKDLKVGDEITINYGCRSSGDFFIHNGFVPEEVPSDVVPLTIVLNKQDVLFQAKAELLKTLNMPTFGRFRLTLNNYENRHKRDPHLTMFLIVYFLLEKEIDLIMKSDNPVGIADEIYEYVQYNQCAAEDDATRQKVNSNGIHSEDSIRSAIMSMKERLSLHVKEYLSRRASICVALINRTLDDSDQTDSDISMMMKHEQSIYESYLIKSNSK